MAVTAIVSEISNTEIRELKMQIERVKKEIKSYEKSIENLQANLTPMEERLEKMMNQGTCKHKWEDTYVVLSLAPFMCSRSCKECYFKQVTSEFKPLWKDGTGNKDK